MARPSQDVTEAELAVLQVLWDRGPATIRQITDVVYESGGASQYATVQKLLERLEVKGGVRRHRGAGVHQFEAAIDRNELIGRRLQAVAETLCEGSITPLLTHLVQPDRLTEEDRQALRALVDQLDQSPSSPPGRGGRGR